MAWRRRASRCGTSPAIVSGLDRRDAACFLQISKRCGARTELKSAEAFLEGFPLLRLKNLGRRSKRLLTGIRRSPKCARISGKVLRQRETSTFTLWGLMPRRKPATRLESPSITVSWKADKYRLAALSFLFLKPLILSRARIALMRSSPVGINGRSIGFDSLASSCMTTGKISRSTRRCNSACGFIFGAAIGRAFELSDGFEADKHDEPAGDFSGFAL